MRAGCASSLNVRFGPVGVPRGIVDPSQQTSMAVIRDAAFQKHLDSFGMDAAPDGTPEKAAALIKDAIAQCAPLVNLTGMEPGESVK